MAGKGRDGGHKLERIPGNHFSVTCISNLPVKICDYGERRGLPNVNWGEIPVWQLGRYSKVWHQQQLLLQRRIRNFLRVVDCCCSRADVCPAAAETANECNCTDAEWITARFSVTEVAMIRDSLSVATTKILDYVIRWKITHAILWRKTIF